MNTEKTTPLYDTHTALGARMAPFGGFLMPIQYTGIFKEHEATRAAVTLFDTCHMGEFFLSGTTVIDDLEKLISCPITNMQHGQCRYGLLCNKTGGVIDDLLVYRIANNEFMLVVNAGTQDGDAEWIQSHLSPETTFDNRSAQTAKIDLQGPGSPTIMNKLIDDGITDLKFYRFKHATYHKEPVIVSRTGYTGEIGFEIYLTPQMAPTFWQEAMQHDAICAGLGARDTLRLEMGMPLYGHELTTTRNAAEAGFARAIDNHKQFIGSNTICDPGNLHNRLVGIRLEGRRAAREGDTILIDDAPAGTVTSGSFAPSLATAIALGYIPTNRAVPGTQISIQTARKAIPGTIVALPFYTEATARKPINDFL